MKEIALGQLGTLKMVVTADESADRFHNVGVQVLATPVLCYWFESAATLAIAEQLDAGEATIGTRLAIEHLAATPIGMGVTVEARVTRVNGRRVEFSAEARDDKEVVARGTHERFVVDLDRFLARVRVKAMTP